MSAIVKAQDQQLTSEVESTDEDQYLTFQLAGDMYAIGILNIKEIIEYGHLTEVPLMPEFVRGVINLRGRVVPVIDLQSRFNRPSSEVGKRTCIVIIEVEAEGERHDIGVVVDAVSAVLEIADADIEPPPSFGAKIRTDFISGMGKLDGMFVIILDVDRVLSVDELTVLTSQTEEVSGEVNETGGEQ